MIQVRASGLERRREEKGKGEGRREGREGREGGREEEPATRGTIDSTQFHSSNMANYTTASDIDRHTGGCRGIDCSARNLGDGRK